jgi:hypothetical protein
MEETKSPAAVLQDQLDRLTTIFDAGAITAEQYEKAVANVHAKSPAGIEAANKLEQERAKAIEDAAAAAEEAARVERERQAVLDRGAAVTKSYLTEEERHESQMRELKLLLDQNAITQETYNRAAARAPGLVRATADAERNAASAERERNEAMKRGESIMRDVMTDEERHAENLKELKRLLDQNAISQDTYNRAADRSRRTHLGDGPQRNLGGGLKEMAADVSQSLPGVASASRLFAAAGGGAAAASLAAGLGAIVAVGVGTAHVISKVNEQAREIDTVSDAAAKLGMSFRDLNTARLSLSQTSGLDTGAIDNSLQRMQVGLHEAKTTGKGDVAETMEKLGLDAGQLLKAGPVEALEQIMEKTRELKNPTDQLMVAYTLFGKQGAALVSSLRDGPEELQRMATWADQVGLNLTEAQAAGVGAANDAWEEMQMITTGMYRQIAAELAPVLQVVAEYVMSGSGAFSSMKDFIPPIVDGTAYFAGSLYDAYEAADLTRKMLHNIITLNFSQIGTDIEKAVDFGTGARNVAAIQKARDEAAAKAFQAQQEKELAKNAEAVWEKSEQKKAQLSERNQAIESQRDAVKKTAAEKLEADRKAALDLEKQKIKEREQAEQKRIQAETQAHERAVQLAESLHSKYTKNFDLSKRLSDVDDLRKRGLINQKDHSKFRDELLEEEARKDTKRATVATATRGSTEEYALVKQGQDNKIDQQLVEHRKQTLIHQHNQRELASIRKALEKSTVLKRKA